MPELDVSDHSDVSVPRATEDPVMNTTPPLGSNEAVGFVDPATTHATAATIFGNAAVESGDMLVVTTPVFARAADDLSISIVDHAVILTGGDGFRQEVTFPHEADTTNLHAVLYDGILELRAPRL